ncbi:MAG TPA: monovalent cation/H(+) antiporter subunit G [Gaiellaceae bacterium]|nr:monovalent cation/H(+) antiporter subunit G [Gaiellaceae bacterium]
MAVVAGNLAVDVLLGVAVAGETLCVLGVLVMRTTFDRLHYAAAGSTVPVFCVLAAALVREHVSSGGLQAIAACGFLFLLGPLLVIATARAARRIDYASVAPLPEERGMPET